MFLREAVAERLYKIAQSLDSGIQLLIFDGYRSSLTQKSIFNDFKQKIALQNPGLSDKELIQKTLVFASHPDYMESTPPHNTGGAIDLSLISNGKLLDMGTDFDDLTSAASTNFFEQDFNPKAGISQHRWIKIRNNRRLLLNVMSQEGFTNYAPEWWHFDLGSSFWSQKVGSDWSYESIEYPNQFRNIFIDFKLSLRYKRFST